MSGDPDLVRQVANRTEHLGQKMFGRRIQLGAAEWKHRHARLIDHLDPQPLRHALDHQVLRKGLELRTVVDRPGQLVFDPLELLVLGQRFDFLQILAQLFQRGLVELLPAAVLAPDTGDVRAVFVDRADGSVEGDRHDLARELELRIAFDLDHAGDHDLPCEPEGVVHRAGDDLDLLGVGNREGDDQDEEAYQEGHEVGEGDHPHRCAGRGLIFRHEFLSSGRLPIRPRASIGGLLPATGRRIG